MSYPILAPRDTWFTQGGTTIKRNTITEINIKDSYTPAGAVTAQWDGSAAKDDSITVYIEGAKLTIAGNGSGKIAANAISEFAFSCSTGPSDTPINLKHITGLEILDTSNVTNFRAMFAHLKSLESVDVSSFDTRKATSMRLMFGCHDSLRPSALSRIIGLENFETSKVTTTAAMFQNISKVPNSDFKGVESWNTSSLEDASFMFVRSGIKNLNLMGWNVSKVNTIQSIFAQTNVEALNLTGWDVSNIQDMTYAFYLCGSLRSLGDLKDWRPQRCTKFAGTFGQCSNLEKQNVEAWDVSSGVYFSHMFADCLKWSGSLDLSQWDMEQAQDLSAMFNDCSGLTEINLSGWNTVNVKAFAQMFERCSNLQRVIGTEGLKTENANSITTPEFGTQPAFAEMFQGCSSLKKLNLADFSTLHAYDTNSAAMKNMFNGMSAIESITLGPNFSRTGVGADPAAVPSFPTPTIPGWDGNWYTSNRTAYAPADIPNNTAQTYYATKTLADASPNLVKSGTMNNIGDAIREKGGASTKMTPLEMPAAIRSISGSEYILPVAGAELGGVRGPAKTAEMTQQMGIDENGGIWGKPGGNGGDREILCNVTLTSSQAGASSVEIQLNPSKNIGKAKGFVFFFSQKCSAPITHKPQFTAQVGNGYYTIYLLVSTATSLADVGEKYETCSNITINNVVDYAIYTASFVPPNTNVQAPANQAGVGGMVAGKFFPQYIGDEDPAPKLKLFNYQNVTFSKGDRLYLEVLW